MQTPSAPARSVSSPVRASHSRDLPADAAAAEERQGAVRARHRRFVRVALGTTLAVLVGVGGFNWFVDPYGMFDNEFVPRATWNDRTEKMKRLRATERPDYVLIGTSRIQKYDPTFLDRLSGTEGFNAAVAGTQMVDQLMLVRWLADRPDAEGHFPHLVYGLDVEAFREQSITPDVYRFPELRSQLTTWEQVTGNATERFLPLWTFQTTSDSARVAGRHLLGRSSSDQTATTQMAANGYFEVGYYDWSFANGQTFDSMYRKNRRQFTAFYERREADAPIPQDARETFEEILAIANEQGDAPTIFIPPMHPRLAAETDALGRPAYMQQVRSYLASLEGEYDFTWYDYSSLESFGGKPDEFFDGVHAMPRTGERIMRLIARDPGFSRHAASR